MNSSLAENLTDECRMDEAFLEQLAWNERMAELGQLAVGMVHELNTPLSVIVSATQLILRDEELSPSVKEMVERIELEVQRLSLFTKGLLSFARKEDGPVGEADLNQVLQEVMYFLKYEALKRSIKIVEDFDYRLPPIAADANRLKQVFINLVMNAFQAMEGGGSLLLRSSSSEERFASVQVADTGSGIPQKTLSRIFEPFYTTKKTAKGTGLGLFITKKIVESFSGTISVESSEGEGTCFTITFPVI
ncbi:MAG: HAMP domain-containing sensor histidine kinase [Geobacteraceae bacterium]|jgi:two-component system NtrC family sensor kinase